MNSYSVRCHNCGKRLPANALTCPACGISQTPHKRRLRCHYCGQRVPAEVVLCPKCQRDPRRFYLRGLWLWGILGAGAFVLLAFVACNMSVWFNALLPRKEPTPTVFAPSRTVVTIVTATPTITETLVVTVTPVLLDTPTGTTNYMEFATGTITPHPTGTFTPPATPP